MPRSAKPITQREFALQLAQEAGDTVSKGQVSKLVSAGMPLASFEDAMQWLAATRGRTRSKLGAAAERWRAARGVPATPPAGLQALRFARSSRDAGALTATLTLVYQAAPVIRSGGG